MIRGTGRRERSVGGKEGLGRAAMSPVVASEGSRAQRRGMGRSVVDSVSPGRYFGCVDGSSTISFT